MSFPKLKYFQASEFDEPDKMNPELLYRLESYRDYIGVPIIITSSTGGNHVQNSQHYLGNAVDIVIPDRKGSLIAQYLIAERFNFSGIGIYPDWCYNGDVIGGFHLDMRPLANNQGARWIGKKSPDGKTQYIPLSVKFLKKYKILI